jgi:hypothetical protein
MEERLFSTTENFQKCISAAKSSRIRVQSAQQACAQIRTDEDVLRLNLALVTSQCQELQSLVETLSQELERTNQQVNFQTVSTMLQLWQHSQQAEVVQEVTSLLQTLTTLVRLGTSDKDNTEDQHAAVSTSSVDVEDSLFVIADEAEVSLFCRVSIYSNFISFYFILLYFILLSLFVCLFVCLFALGSELINYFCVLIAIVAQVPFGCAH